MLRNSTKQFRLRYQTNNLQPYTANGRINIIALDFGHLASSNLLSIHSHGANQNSPHLPQPAPSKLEPSSQSSQDIDDNLLPQNIKRKKAWDAGDSTVSRDPKQFLKGLTKNSIFFCCSCYQYVFEIEKQRHFPDCKDAIDMSLKHSDCFRKIACERLEKIVELARYTKTKSWEVEELYRQVKSNDFSKIYSVRCPRQCTFLALQEIVTAFVYTYEGLLKGVIFTPSPFFICG